MDNFDDPLAALSNKPATPKAAAFDDALAAISPATMAQATGQKPEPKMIRKTIYMPSAQLAYIRQIAADQEMGLMATFRWLLDYSLQKYDGGIRPKMETAEIRKVARLGHPTSKGE